MGMHRRCSIQGVVRTAQLLWRYGLGYLRERVVGEELNQLLGDGFKVYHDVAFDGFNIDHVVVGPPGVYEIETKVRRKPTHVEGPARAMVVFDGSPLWFPNATEQKPLEQARRNARALSEWLSKATGETVSARAILTLPGWWAVRKAVTDVHVLNPSEIKYSFPARPASPLTADQLQRVCHQLSERCRLTKAG